MHTYAYSIIICTPTPAGQPENRFVTFVLMLSAEHVGQVAAAASQRRAHETSPPDDSRELQAHSELQPPRDLRKLIQTVGTVCTVSV